MFHMFISRKTLYLNIKIETAYIDLDYDLHVTLTVNDKSLFENRECPTY